MNIVFATAIHHFNIFAKIHIISHIRGNKSVQFFWGGTEAVELPVPVKTHQGTSLFPSIGTA